jgi:hypothetical protein
MRNEELLAEAQNKIVVFGAKRIRRTWHEEQWFFSVVDVVAALTDSADPKQYIKKMRQRDSELDRYWGTVCTPLDLPAADGKIRKSNCANTEGIFRIVQSIPSPKAEPFNWRRNLARRLSPARTISRTSPARHCQARRKIRPEIQRAWRPPGQQIMNRKS